MGAPVVAVFPFVDETLHIRERDAIIPASVAQIVRKAGVGEFAVKEGKGIIRYGNLEAVFRWHDTSTCGGRASEKSSLYSSSLYSSQVGTASDSR